MDDSEDKKENKSTTDDPAELKENLIKTNTKTQQSPNLVQEGIIAGKKIAKISVITLLAIGVVEIITGILSGSVVATADGIDSISDAVISFIVLLGLRIAHKPADKKFHFGYHKVESFSALIAAIGMIVIGVIIFYNSYQALIHPHEIKHPYIVMAVLAGASALSLHRAFQMQLIANKYNLLSLKTDARNSIKDGSASVIGFFSILVATQFGFVQMDGIGGMIIAGYIFSVSYLSLKKSSLILIDSWQNPKLTVVIKNIISEQFSDEKIVVRDVLLRSSGMVDQAEIHIAVDGKESLEEVETLSQKIQSVISSHFPSIERVVVIPHPYTASETRVTSRMDRFRNIKLKRPYYSSRSNKSEQNPK
ncbi:cation diffusion facilitator family transporter [Candidatus Nitrosocosmicus franklandus]|uniref:Putative cation efflux system protein n=1 Tax=Candidatus Nitrosocosmicus franklandianus TaxID=1798806 RepID=A0A484IDV8_9ARCH|nr:cation diffusion facilitator family transporter [Candidatus Nitrosocosmicus franklandus]VFJ14259.1 putative cation efflux system protein [Candidatus Nitrosocosmicus franklandus]